jgi:precorrin-6B methylase 2
MSIDALRQIVGRLNTAATALSGLSLALDARIREEPLEGSLEPYVSKLLAVLQAEEALAEATPAELTALLGEVRTLAYTNARLLAAAAEAPAWCPTDPEVLQAAGKATARLASSIKNAIAPELDGLVSRLQSPHAHFLDVGTGVGALSIEMAREWPQLQIVGVEPWAPALALARANVNAAQLQRRIELRGIPGETLLDERAFDLAWIPSLFVPARKMPELLRSVLRALKPGGWLLLVALRASGDELALATARLRTACWGGSQLTPDAARELLLAAGFHDVRALLGSASAVSTLLAAQRPGPSAAGRS